MLKTNSVLKCVFGIKPANNAEIRDIFQDESDSGKLSLRELEVMFSDKGLTVSHKTLGLFFFASDNLQELQEYAFKLSHAKVEEIKKLHSTCSQFQNQFSWMILSNIYGQMCWNSGITNILQQT